MRTRLVEAVLAAALVELLPRNAHPVLNRLRGAVQRSCPVPVACIAGQARHVKAGAGYAFAVPGTAAVPHGGLEHGPGAVEVSLRAQDQAHDRHHDRVLVSDLLLGLRRGFQVSPGGGDVPSVQGSEAGVAVQGGVSEMVAGSFGAGDRFGEQLPGPGRVDGQEIQEQAPGQQDVVAEPAGALDSLLPERAPYVRLAGPEICVAQCRKGADEQPVVAQLPCDLDRLFSKVPRRGDVNPASGPRGGDQRCGEQRGVRAGVGPPEHRHEQPEGLLQPGTGSPVAVERHAQAQHQRGPVRAAGRMPGGAPHVGLIGVQPGQPAALLRPGQVSSGRPGDGQEMRAVHPRDRRHLLAAGLGQPLSGEQPDRLQQPVPQGH